MQNPKLNFSKESETTNNYMKSSNCSTEPLEVMLSPLLKKKYQPKKMAKACHKP